MKGINKSWLLGCMMFSIMSTGAEHERHCGAQSDTITYDWEKIDFYDMLGLPSAQSKASRQKRKTERQKSTSKDVRRAYRRQAQLYHPDKKNDTISVEESNVRFARIAEAYEVLGNQTKRSNYDLWLLDCEDYLHQGPSSNQQANHGSERWSMFERAKDPRRVFEEFFYGSSESKNGDFFNMFQSTLKPVRVHEHKELLYDNYGNKIIRVFQTEEYTADHDGTFFYRIVVQDYAERYDRFHGWVYEPISQPFVTDEGYRHESVDRSDGNSHSHSHKKDTLHLGEILTPDSPVLSSKNARYYAGITQDCELVIMSDSTLPDMDNFLMWSSKTSLPNIYKAGSCFLSLRGPHLVLSVGDPNRPGVILWHSDVPESIIRDEARLKESGDSVPVYYARLDDDGSLSVYMVRETSTHSANGKENCNAVHSSEHWLSQIVSTTRFQFRSKVEQGWSVVHKWRQNILRSPQSKQESKNSTEDTDSSQSSLPKEFCVYATGIAGCNVGARKLLKLGRGLGQSASSTLTRLDSAIDTIFDFFQADIENDEDDDAIDRVSRILGKTRNELGKAYQKIAAKGVNAVRQAINKRKAKRMS